MDVGETLSTSDVVELVKRHSPLHKVNIKYGYIIFGLSILFILIRTGSIWFYQRAWRRSGRSTSLLKITSFPLPLTISLIALMVALLMIIKPHYEKITVSIKRLGRLSYALIPLDIFLAAHPAWISIDNYLNTIQLHKWISRLIIFLILVHSIGFLVYYIDVGKFNKVFKVVNLIGVLVFFDSIIMALFWKKVRDFNYRFFYINHNIFVFLLVVLIYFHARPGVSFFFIINIILLSANIIRRYLHAKDITMTEIIENPGSDLRIVKFPKTLLPENYLPGCHIRIGFSKWSPLFVLLASHPYTVATTFENRDLLSSLIIKKTKFKLEPFETYSIQTNFKSSLSENFFNTVNNLTIVCGGSGISLGLGLFEYFKRSIIADGRDIKLKFIWITRHEEDTFILDELNIQGCDVFISNRTTDTLTTDDDPIDNNDIPLTELSNNSEDSLNSYEQKFTNTVILGKSPNLKAIIAKNSSRTFDYANKWVVACGPVSLNADCQEIAKEQKCRFFSEEYSF